MTKRQMSCEQALNMLGPAKAAPSPPKRLVPIRLRREGDFVIVSVEVDGQWREVIREFWDSPFSHIWEGHLSREENSNG